jgi:putative ABC transport system substrate-binding protein
MRRRDFIALLGSAAAWPLAARAQQPAMPVIGFLSSALPDRDAGRLRAFRQGLAETGYVEGRNVAIEYRWAEEQNDRLPALAADLVRRQVAVIATAGDVLGAFAAKTATTTIPIVFTTGRDPVEIGLVASLNRPGGNLTGVATLGAELEPKRVELLHEAIPSATIIGALVNSAARNAELLSRDLRAAARTLGLELHVLNASTEGDFDSVFADLVRLRAGGLVIATDALFISRSEQGRRAGATPRDADNLSIPRVCHGRRADELRRQCYRLIPSVWRLYGPHPQGRQARRFASRAVDQVRVRHQPPDCQSDRPRSAGDAARPRRRGDRISYSAGILLRCMSRLIALSDRFAA